MSSTSSKNPSRLGALLVLVVAITVAFLLSTFVRYVFGTGFAGVSERAKIVVANVGKADDFQEFRLNDGTIVRMSCFVPESSPVDIGDPQDKSNGAMQVSSWLSCSVWVGVNYILKFEIWDSTNVGRFRSSIRFFNAPWLVDGVPSRTPGNQISLTHNEGRGRTYVLGELVSTIPFCFNINYYVEEDSLKALIVSSLQEGAHLDSIRIDEFSVNRIAKELVQRIDHMTGFFKIRKDRALLLIGGTFQSVVMFVFFFCLALTAFVYFQLATRIFPVHPLTVDAIGVLAGSLGASLTYFGLLGTLLGIFLAVGDLSAIDFVDEMKKVFDQTKSFGSMSLALGSSVLGLGGALTLWIIQAIGNFIYGRTVFEL